MAERQLVTAPPRLRLLLISPLPPPTGGIATWTAILMDRVGRDPSIDLCHVNLANRTSAGDYGPGLRLVRRLAESLRDLGRIASALARFRPAVVHLTTSAGFGSFRDILVLGAARQLGAATVIDYHTSELTHQFQSGSWLCRPARLAMSLADGIRVLEPGSEAIARAVGGQALVRRIPNMIDYERIDRQVAGTVDLARRPPRPATIHLVYVGRVVPAKGVSELVEACTATAGVELDLVGPIGNSYRRHLRSRAAGRAEGAWLKVRGSCLPEAVHRWIQAADIVALPSHAEAFPNAVLEAMVLARPVLATTVGAIPEMIDADGAAPAGVCVAPRSVEALRQGLERLHSHRDGWAKMGAAGRRRVRRQLRHRHGHAAAPTVLARCRRGRPHAGRR